MSPEQKAEINALITAFGNACFDCGEWRQDDEPSCDYATMYAAQESARRTLETALAPKPCTCGSGMHPRECLQHPQGFELHLLQLNYERAMEVIHELEAKIERLQAELLAVRAEKEWALEKLRHEPAGQVPALVAEIERLLAERVSEKSCYDDECMERQMLETRVKDIEAIITAPAKVDDTH